MSDDYTFEPGPKTDGLDQESYDSRCAFAPGDDDTHGDDEPSGDTVRKYGFDPSERLAIWFYSEKEQKWEHGKNIWCYGALVYKTAKRTYLKALMFTKTPTGGYEVSLLHQPHNELGVGE